MPNPEKDAILRALISGVLTDLMVKTNVYNVMVDGETTLAAKLYEIIQSLNGKVSEEELRAAAVTINGEGPDESGNFIINTVSDIELARLAAALT